MTAAKPTGECPDCEEWFKLRKDGMLPEHRRWKNGLFSSGWKTCSGSDYYPVDQAEKIIYQKARGVLEYGHFLSKGGQVKMISALSQFAGHDPDVLRRAAEMAGNQVEGYTGPSTEARRYRGIQQALIRATDEAMRRSHRRVTS